MEKHIPENERLSEENQPKGMRQMCREIFGTENMEELRNICQIPNLEK